MYNWSESGSKSSATDLEEIIYLFIGIDFCELI